MQYMSSYDIMHGTYMHFHTSFKSIADYLTIALVTFSISNHLPSYMHAFLASYGIMMHGYIHTLSL